MKPTRESFAGFTNSALKVGQNARQSLAGFELGARDAGSEAVRAVSRLSEGFPLRRKDNSEKPAPPPRTVSKDKDAG